MAAETPRCACMNRLNGAYQHVRHPNQSGKPTLEDVTPARQVLIEEDWDLEDLDVDEDMDDYHQHVRSASRSNTRQGQHNIEALSTNAAGYSRLSSEDASSTIAYVRSMTITRQEFEALPLTIQRKCFSTLERLRFAQELEASQEAPSSIVPFHELYDPLPIQGVSQFPQPEPEQHKKPRRYQRHKVTPSALDLASRNQPRFKLSEERFYVNLPDKIKRRHLSEDEQLIAQHYPRTVLLDAADESLIKAGRATKSLDLDEHLTSDPYLAFRAFSPADMSSRPQTSQRATTANTESFLDAIHFLNDGDDLDLSLGLQDYHSSIKEEPLQMKSRRPYFRRHLSISKLSSLSRTTAGNNETFFRDSSIAPSLRSAPSPIPSTPMSHGRRTSRTVSLIGSSKHFASESDDAQGGDSAASHYRDPEARMKLRVYLASPQKFDEALEFGFPSLDEERHEVTFLDPIKSTDEGNEKWLSTFLDDDKSSICSDDHSAADPESPRTPPMDGSMTLQPPRAETNPANNTHGDYAQAPLNSREMTLRMTLTRPDLRSHEDQIYGRKSAPPTRKSHIRGDSFPPVLNMADTDAKESMERHFAALDQENVEAQGHGVVKRLWKRVRRT